MGMHCILAQPHESDPRTSSMQLWACAARLYRALGLGLCKGLCRPGWAVPLIQRGPGIVSWLLLLFGLHLC